MCPGATDKEVGSKQLSCPPGAWARPEAAGLWGSILEGCGSWEKVGDRQQRASVYPCKQLPQRQPLVCTTGK